MSRFLSHAAIYGAGNILLQVASFVLLPLYLRSLTEDEFGVLEIIGRFADTVGVLLLLGGFRLGLFTFYKRAESDHERRQIVTAAFVLVIGGASLGLLFGSFFLAPMAVTLSSETVQVQTTALWLAMLAILVEPLTQMPLTLMQARMESLRYVSVVVVQLLLRIILALLFVRVLGWGLFGALAATLLMSAVLGLILSIRELTLGVARPSWDQFRSMLLFALPLLPGGICYFILHNADRFFLVPYCSLAEIGEYSIGYRVGQLVTVLTFTPLYMVWCSQMYEVAKKPEVGTNFGQMFTRILMVHLLGVVGASLFADEALALLAGRRMPLAVAVVAPVALACFWQNAATLAEGGFYIHARTTRKLLVTLVSTGVVLALYAWLIPLYGTFGAALATLGSFAFLAWFTYLLSQGVLRVQYEWGRLVSLLALAFCAWVVGQQLPFGIVGVLGKVAIVATLPVVAWVCGIISREEKKSLGQMLASRGLAVSH